MSENPTPQQESTGTPVDELTPAPTERVDGRTTRSTRGESLVDHVREIVLDDLIKGRLTPGTMIQIPAIAERAGVSRTPVREALTLLAREGLVTPIPYKGYLVKPIEPADINDVFFMRLLLEPAATELAAARLSDEEIDQLRVLVEQPTEPPATNMAFEHNTRDFHEIIVRAAGSRRLLNAFHENYFDVRRMQYVGVGNQRPDLVLIEHEKIVAAFAARDAAKARAEMEEHIAGIRQRSIEAWIGGV